MIAWVSASGAPVTAEFSTALRSASIFSAWWVCSTVLVADTTASVNRSSSISASRSRPPYSLAQFLEPLSQLGEPLLPPLLQPPAQGGDEGDGQGAPNHRDRAERRLSSS